MNSKGEKESARFSDLNSFETGEESCPPAERPAKQQILQRERTGKETRQRETQKIIPVNQHSPAIDGFVPDRSRACS